MVLDAQKMEDKAMKKILIIAPNWLGDAVLALPAIARIRELFPSPEISILGLPHVCELYKESPYVDVRMIYSGSLLSTVNKVKEQGFHLAVLLPNSFKTALIAKLAGIPLRCGYNRDGRGIMLNIGIEVDAKTKGLSQVEYYMNIVNHVIQKIAGDEEIPINPPLEKGGEGGFEWLHLSEAELRYAADILQKYNVAPGALIAGMNPGAAYGSAKRWYPERFAQVASTLANRHKAHVIIFGRQQETGIAGDIEKLSEGSVINMAGRTNIRELMSLIKQCKVFITNDSGPMHIASALGVPVVAIFGSTDPAKTGPMGGNSIVITKNVDCSPCFKRICPTDLRCMDRITVDDVMDGIHRILG